jgi:hypothetical protein
MNKIRLKVHHSNPLKSKIKKLDKEERERVPPPKKKRKKDGKR